MAILQKLRHNEFGSVNTDSEAKTLAGPDRGSIDADHLALRVDQRTPRVTGIQSRIRLDNLVHHAPTRRSHAAPQCTDNAGGNGELETVGIPNRDRELTYFQV